MSKRITGKRSNEPVTIIEISDGRPRQVEPLEKKVELGSGTRADVPAMKDFTPFFKQGEAYRVVIGGKSR